MKTKNYTGITWQSNSCKKCITGKIIILFSVLFVALMNAAMAQDTKRKDPPAFSVGIESAVPTGDLSLLSSFGLGASMKVIVPLDNTVAFTASVGYIRYFGKDLFGFKMEDFNSFPLKGGFRFSTKPGFYVEPQAGYSSFSTNGESDGAFTYAGSIGYVIHKKTDFSFRYESATKNGGSLSHVGLRIAYNITGNKNRKPS